MGRPNRVLPNRYLQFASTYLVGCLATVSSSAVLAQQADPQATLPKITVRGQDSQEVEVYAGDQVGKSANIGLLGNLDLMNTPFNITSYTSELVENQLAFTIGDIVANDPSIRNPYGRGGETDEFITRGFITYNRDVAFNGLYGILPFSTIPVEIFERVEVLKGPSAMLNGMPPSGTIGGNIWTVPKRAGLEPLNRFTASYGSDSLIGGHLDVGRRFGADQQYGLRFNGIYRSGDLAIEPTKEALRVGAIGFDYAGERTRASIDVGYQKRDLDAQQTFLFNFLVTPNVPPPSASRNWTPPWTYWDYETVFGVVRGEFDLSERWTVFAAVGAKDEESRSLQTTMSLRAADGTLRAAPFDQKGYQDVLSAEAGIRGSFETGPIQHRTSLSVNTYEADTGDIAASGAFVFSNLYAPVNVPPPARTPLGNVPKTSGAELRSIGIADTMSMLQEKLQVTVGLRHQQVDAESFNAATGAHISDYSESAVTPAVGVVVKPWGSNVSLYANYVEGLSQGPTAPISAENRGQVFAPYESEQYEAGVKFDFGQFGTSFAAFQISRPNSYTDPVTNVFGLDGEQRNRGLELNLFGAPVAGVRLLGGVAYTDAELTKTRAGVNEGNTAVGVPEVQVNLNAEWDMPFLKDLTLTSRLIYTSEQYLDSANTQEISSWTRVDLGARYRFTAGRYPIVLRANIENLFDRDYWSSTSRESLYLGAPRTVLMSASIDF